MRLEYIDTVNAVDYYIYLHDVIAFALRDEDGVTKRVLIVASDTYTKGEVKWLLGRFTYDVRCRIETEKCKTGDSERLLIFKQEAGGNV